MTNLDLSPVIPFGLQLKALRNKHGLSAQDLANLTDIDRCIITNMENNSGVYKNREYQIMPSLLKCFKALGVKQINLTINL